MTTNATHERSSPLRGACSVGVVSLAVLILALVGCSRNDPSEPATGQTSSAAASDSATSGWKLDLKIAPEHPRMVRPATFAVHITDSAGRPVENAQVTGSLNMTLMDMGRTAVKFTPKGNGDYEATVRSFDMSGPWELTIEASQGAIRARRVFPVTVFD